MIIRPGRHPYKSKVRVRAPLPKRVGMYPAVTAGTQSEELSAWLDATPTEYRPMTSRMFPLVALSLLTGFPATRSASAGSIPIAVSGFNQDMVVEAGAANDATTHYTNAVTATMDGGTARTNFTWYESGLPGGTGGGLPASGVFASASDPTTQFALGSYTGMNALLLNASTTSATLTLATPGQFSLLSFLTSTGSAFFGTPVLWLTIHFNDGTPALSGLSFASPDWFSTDPGAIAGQGRVNVETGDFDQVGSSFPRMFQRDVVLPVSARSHTIASIDIAWASNGSDNAQTAVFALSGTVPEPSSIVLLGTAAIALTATAWKRRNVRG